MCRVFDLEVSESPEELEEMLKSEKDVRKRERLQQQFPVSLFSHAFQQIKQ